LYPILSTVGYTVGPVVELELVVGVVGSEDEGYSRSATAWLDERSGGDVSFVALGTEVEDVLLEMVRWSRLHHP
jgi:hypothetical protein